MHERVEDSCPCPLLSKFAKPGQAAAPKCPISVTSYGKLLSETAPLGLPAARQPSKNGQWPLDCLGANCCSSILLFSAPQNEQLF